ncbi:MAG: PorV/PorQ family protein [Bacteroidia bacterium]
MRFKSIKTSSLIATALLIGSSAFAGNPERQGQAGAAQLTINGWARSSGLGYAAGGLISGAEALYMNVGGLDRMTNRTELVFARTEWLMGSGIGINNLGLAVKMGEDGYAGTLGVQVMQFGIDPIQITTEQNPHGGIGTYRVNMTNIGVSYGKQFSNSISAGITARLISEGIPDVSASGMALDAGVQYTTTLIPRLGSEKRNDFKFGVSVKNIGPDLKFDGDGLSYKALIQDGDYNKTMQVKTDVVKLPAMLNVAASYDIRLDKTKGVYDNRLTVGFGFTNHSFSANQTTLSFEYGYKDMLMVRGGYCYQQGVFSEETRTSAFTGPFAGVSYDWHINDENTVSLDYSYRATNPFSGVHSFGVRIGLGSAE